MVGGGDGDGGGCHQQVFVSEILSLLQGNIKQINFPLIFFSTFFAASLVVSSPSPPVSSASVRALSAGVGEWEIGRAGDRTVGRDGMERDGVGRDGVGRDGVGRGGVGRDGAGRKTPAGV